MDDLLDDCRDLPLVDVAEGALIIEQGQAPGAFLVLVEGAVTIERDGIAFARIDTPGALLGEMSVVLGEPATASVRAATLCTLRRADDGLGFLGDHPAAALAVARTVSTRLDLLTKYLIDVKRQFADRDGHLGMVDQVLDVLVHHHAPPVRPGSARLPDPEY